MTRDESLVGLSDAIEALRSDLMKSMALGADEKMQFSLEPIELTVQASVTKAADGGFSWKILKAGASFENVQTQTLKLRLSPFWFTESGEPTRDFTIADHSPGSDALPQFGPRGEADAS